MNALHSLSIIFFVAASISVAQNPGVQALSQTTADEMAAGLAANDHAKVDSTIANTAGIYGTSEVTLRVKILSKIMRGHDANEDIKAY